MNNFIEVASFVVNRSNQLRPYSKSKLELNSKKSRTRVMQKCFCLYVSFLN